MASATPTVLIVSRDPEVKQVAAALQADGLTARNVASPRELQRALNTKTRSVIVLDDELAADDAFASAEILEKVHSLPTLVLVAPNAEMLNQSSADNPSIEEFVRKPIASTVLALRVKALILAAGLSLPTVKAAPVVEQGPLDLSSDSRGELTVVFSVKGGSGKSTIAANLAAGLASLYSVQTLLVDANLWFG
ncbi:MAG: hypothetical protein JOZ65_11240, partial [Chloroflexi bacterium]|nr:hypothetical protein [Chloroflexota bacterium]